MKILDNNVKDGDIITLNESDLLIINTLYDSKYIYNVITFVSQNKKMYIGQFCVFNYDYSKEWVEYNDNYIFFLSHINSKDANMIDVLGIFDIKNKCLIKQNKDELLTIYQEEINQKVKIK